MWQTNKNTLEQTFTFNNFDDAIDFINKIAKIARSMDHHPTVINTYNTVTVQLTTHDSGDSITDKDRSFAASIDELLNPSKPKVSELSKSPNQIKLYGDGGSRGNPGPSASGFVLMTADDEILFSQGVYLGITTNNQAEYHSLRLGLEEAKRRGAREVAVFMDSLLVINQMKGIFKVKNRDLWPIHESIKALLPDFKKVTFTHVPRELNKLADAEVNKALDAEADN